MKKLKSEIEKIRQLPGRERIRYLWGYYKVYLLLFIFFIVIFCYFILPLFTQRSKNTLLSIAIIDSSQIAREDTSRLNSMAVKYFNGDENTDKIQIDTSGTTYDTSSSSSIKVTILLSSVGENDVIICGQELYERYNDKDAFLNIEEYKSLICPTAYSACIGNVVSLDNCPLWSNLGYTDYTPVYACIPVSCKQPEKAVEFINFLFSN